MANETLAAQLEKLKMACAKWSKDLATYSAWALNNDGVLSPAEKAEIERRKVDIKAIQQRIAQIEKAKGINSSTTTLDKTKDGQDKVIVTTSKEENDPKTYTTDPKKKWSFSDFEEESKHVVVDHSKLKAKELEYFTNYENVAQTYINRMVKVYEGKNAYAKKKGEPEPHKLPPPITGKMLADAALKTYIKYNHDISKVVPVELMLAQCQCETHFGTAIKRKGSVNSPFNVGVYDSSDASFLDKVDNPEEGIEMYYDLMAEDYLSNHNANQLEQSFVNESGARYATAKDYETTLRSIEGTVKKIASESGVKMPNGEGMQLDEPVDKPEEHQNPPKETKTTATLSATVGDGGKNVAGDVMLVKKLLNKKISAGLTETDVNCGPKTIAAIKKFQQQSFGWSDGLVEPGGDTWKALNGSGTTANNNNQQNNQQHNTAGDSIYDQIKAILDKVDFVSVLLTGISENTRKLAQEAMKLIDQWLSNAENIKNTQRKSFLEGVIDAIEKVMHSGSGEVLNPVIKKSVGKGGDNDPADVRRVQQLLGIPVTGTSDAKLIQAISQFQQTHFGWQDGKIDAGGTTWNTLLHGGNEEPEHSGGEGAEPAWISVARQEKSKNPIEGQMTVGEHPIISQYFLAAGKPAFDFYKDKKIAGVAHWCAAFVTYCMKNSDNSTFGWPGLNVNEWKKWASNNPENKPFKGAIAIYKSQHIGFVTKVKNGKVTLLGGNQGAEGAGTISEIPFGSVGDYTFVCPPGYKVAEEAFF